MTLRTQANGAPLTTMLDESVILPDGTAFVSRVENGRIVGRGYIPASDEVPGGMLCRCDMPVKGR